MEMGLGIQAGGVTGSSGDRFEHRRDRALALGASHQDARELSLGLAKAGEQFAHPRELSRPVRDGLGGRPDTGREVVEVTQSLPIAGLADRAVGNDGCRTRSVGGGREHVGV